MSDTSKYAGHTPGPYFVEYFSGPMGSCFIREDRKRNNDEDIIATVRCVDASATKATVTLLADAPKLLAERDALLEAARNILCPGGGVYASPQLEGALRAAVALVEGK